MLLDILIFTVAIMGLTKTADWFLGSAEKVGLYIGLPSFILGVILVGFGTSLPELATSISSVVDGQTNIVIANILGSNMANILLIISMATIVMGTIRFEKNIIDIDLPLLLGTTFLFVLLVIDGSLTSLDSLLLLSCFIGYIVYSIYYKEDREEFNSGSRKLIASLIRGGSKSDTVTTNIQKPKLTTYLVLIFSLLALGISSKIAVDSLIRVVSEVNIAVGVVSFFALAIGTSLPELVVSIKALKKGRGDIVIGNIIGSCMFNMLLVGSVSGLISPQSLATPLGYWMLAGVVISALLLVVSGITRKIHVWEGGTFLFVYVAIAFHLL